MKHVHRCQALEMMGDKIGFSSDLEDIDQKGIDEIPKLNGQMINFCPFCGERIGNVMVPDGECVLEVMEDIPNEFADEEDVVNISSPKKRE